MRFSHFKHHFAVAAFSFLVLCSAVGGTSPSYVNSGSVTNPIIDATTFLNQGYIETSSSVPYETYNTLAHENRGTMVGSVGFRFNCYTNSLRKRSASFTNLSSIRADDGFTSFFGSGSESYIYVNSSNIVNRGTMQVGSGGLLQLTGNKVDLRGGAVVASSSLSSAPIYTSLDSFMSTNYSNEPNIYEYYWGVGTNNVLSGQGFGLQLANGQMDKSNGNFGSGTHEVINNSLYTNSLSLPFFPTTNLATFAFSSQLSATSSIVQVVFVSTNLGSGLNVDARFSATNNFNSGARSAIVQFSALTTNILTGLPVTQAVYFADSMAIAVARTNLSYQNNRSSTSSRPNVYDVTTYTPTSWAAAALPNTTYTPSLLYDPTVHQNSQPDNFYAAYAVEVGATTTTTNFANSAILNDPSNSVGRVEITGDFVDVNLARLYSEGLLTITATNFQALNQSARLEAEQMRLNLTSTNETFILTNILGGTVRRIGGWLAAYSCTWTNLTLAGDEIRYHVLILDSGMNATQPSLAYGFTMRVTNQANSSIIIEDPVNVARELLLDAKNITIRDELTVSDTITPANMPNLLNFTNEGSIYIPNAATITCSNGPITTFVNRSSIFADSIFVSAATFQNRGLIQSSGSTTISNSAAGSVVDLSGGWNIANIDFSVTADTLRATNSMIAAGSVVTNSGTVQYNLGAIILAANALIDSPAQINSWECLNGFQLHKVNSASGWGGDLLHTELKTTIKPYGYVDHVWSGADFGTVSLGFTNNAALGKLIVDMSTSGQAVFHGPSATGNWALYVDYLDLRNFATNWQSVLQIDSNFRIYFADCSVRPEKLDKVNGLYWVKDYAGFYSGTNVVINGQSKLVNRALYTSTEIDSDGDGTPNAYDPSPFDGVTISSSVTTSTVPHQINISWKAAADTDYTVQYTTNLSTNTTWTTLTTVHTTTAGLQNVLDFVSNGSRVYRVLYNF